MIEHSDEEIMGAARVWFWNRGLTRRSLDKLGFRWREKKTRFHSVFIAYGTDQQWCDEYALHLGRGLKEPAFVAERWAR